MTIKQPFMPAYGTNQVVTPGAASSAAIALDTQKTNRQVCLQNTGANICYVRIGDSGVAAATTADYPIPAGQIRVISKNPEHTHFRHISATGTTLQVMLGEGF